MPDSVHPCLTCGACCASFRVDFSVEEMQERGGTVPGGLAVTVTSTPCRMRGTDHVPARCAALTGEKAACCIYEWPRHPAASSRRGTMPATGRACDTDCRR